MECARCSQTAIGSLFSKAWRRASASSGIDRMLYTYCVDVSEHLPDTRMRHAIRHLHRPIILAAGLL